MIVYLTVHDTKVNEYHRYCITDAPSRLFLTEETQRSPHRFVYTLSALPLPDARTLTFDDFIPILFFELAFEPISHELWVWIDSLTS